MINCCSKCIRLLRRWLRALRMIIKMFENKIATAAVQKCTRRASGGVRIDHPFCARLLLVLRWIVRQDFGRRNSLLDCWRVGNARDAANETTFDLRTRSRRETGLVRSGHRSYGADGGACCGCQTHRGPKEQRTDDAISTITLRTRVRGSVHRVPYTGICYYRISTF